MRRKHPTLCLGAALVVDHIAGGRFETLVRFANLPDTAAIRSEIRLLELELEGDLHVAQIPRGHAFFRALLLSKHVDSSVQRQTGISAEALTKLLKANIIMAHPDNTVTFHSRFVERYFQRTTGDPAVVVPLDDAASALPQLEAPTSR